MSVQCGDNHTICFGGSGELWVFGGNEKGQLGLGHNQVVENPIVNEKLVNIHSVSCGDRFSVCVDGSGDVWVFGSNIMGNLGFPDTSKSFFEPTKCPILKDIRYVSCGSRHTACVDSSGFVWTFGLNNYGQLGLGDRTNRCEPTQVEILSGINSVACGAYHSIFLSSSGKAFSCGRNSFGQLMLGTTTRVTVATPVPPLHAPVAQVACGADHTMFLLEDDTVYGAGCNQKGQLGCLFAAERKVPTKIKDLCGIIRLSCGYNQTMCINTEEELILLGSGEYERTSVMRQNAKNVMKMEERIYALSYGGFHTIFKGVTGKTWAFGRNDCGQLGLGRPSHTDPNYIPSPRLLSESLMEALWEKQTTAKSARK